MSLAQNWALIGLVGVFATAVVTLMMFSMTGLRSEMSSLRHELRAEIGALHSEMSARFESLDRDVQALMNHVSGRGSA